MAAHRKDCPLLHTGGFIRVMDGTECRMPSPVPGPLRAYWDPPPVAILRDGRAHEGRFCCSMFEVVTSGFAGAHRERQKSESTKGPASAVPSDMGLEEAFRP